MAAIPMELITMGVSAIWAGLQTYASKKAEAQEYLFERAMAKGEFKEGSTERARKFTGWYITRRTLAISVIGAVIVWPMFAPAFFPDLNITVGWTEMTNGFWPFVDAKDSMTFQTINNGGIVVTPLMTHMCSAITGFFFGNQIAK